MRRPAVESRAPVDDEVSGVSRRYHETRHEHSAGKWTPLFKDVTDENLKLVQSRIFKSGNILLYYEQPRKK